MFSFSSIPMIGSYNVRINLSCLICRVSESQFLPGYFHHSLRSFLVIKHHNRYSAIISRLN